LSASAAPATKSDAAWLAQVCIARGSFSLIFMAYSAALPLLLGAWQMSAGQAGLVQSAWHFGYMISLFTIGFIADRYGARRVYLVSSFAATLSAFAFACFADGFLSGLILYGLAGLFSGGSYTPGLTLIAERFAATRGRAMGFYLSAASIGYALSLVLVGALTPVIGWRGALIATACGPLIGIAFSWLALHGTPNLVHPHPPREVRANPVREVVANRPAMLAIWAYAFHSWELLGLKAWLPAFLTAAALATGAGTLAAVSLGALLTALTYIASALGSYTGGALSDRKGRTWTMLVMTLASTTCAFSFGWMLGLPLGILTGVACLFIFASIGDSAVYSTAVTELVPGRLIGGAYSVRSVLGFGAGALSPWVFGLVLDATRAASLPESQVWGYAWSALGMGALLGPVAILALRAHPASTAMAGGKR
jgi:MFS family permease